MPAQFLYILQPRCGLSFVAGSYHIFMVGKQKECEEPVLFQDFWELPDIPGIGIFFSA